MAKKTRSEKNKLRRLEQRERQKFFRIFGTAFLGLLLAVMLLHFILPDRSYSGAEKRALTQLPALNGRTLSSGEYMSQMDSYLADQFPLRTELMRIRTNLSRFLGQTESQGVFYCSDGSLIEAFDEYDFSLTEKTLEAVGSFLESYKFRNRIFLLIPSAVTLYADKLPAYAQTASEKEYISNVREILPRSLSRPDLLSLLKSVQASGVQVFYETDHHWTTRAAYEVFAALAKDKRCACILKDTADIETIIRFMNSGVKKDDVAGDIIDVFRGYYNKEAHMKKISELLSICLE